MNHFRQSESLPVLPALSIVEGRIVEGSAAEGSLPKGMSQEEIRLYRYPCLKKTITHKALH
jgi:hypothetical protein